MVSESLANCAEGAAVDNFDPLQDKLGYRFKDIKNITRALTHGSYVGERGRGEEEGLSDNERLEFLGDAVLELVVRSHLVDRFPDLAEGKLSRLRSALVNKRTLAGVARSLELGEHLLLGKGEDLSRGRTKTSILADAYEAVLAAIFLEGGLAAVTSALELHYFPQVAAILTRGYFEDYKTQLQELVQGKFRVMPVYHLRCEMGRDHDKLFEFDLLVGDRLLGRGTGKTKKEAEQKAARVALEALKDEL